MSVKKFINRQVSHFERKSIKKQVVQKIIESEQQNIDVVNIHRYDVNNAGDLYCGPHHYFNRLQQKHLDIFRYDAQDVKQREQWIDKVVNNALIIGGGGLLNLRAFEKQMSLFEHLSTKGKKTVLWGVGHNNHKKKNFGKTINYNVDTSKFGLVGVRDYGTKEQWVPCVSCLHPFFDKKYTSTQELGVVFHLKTLKNRRVKKIFKDVPSISNKEDFNSVINFISKTDLILTDSYHAMYWAMLLGKKVMVFPNSTKFYNFKYQPLISTYSNYKKDLKKVTRFEGVLEECRQANRLFSEKVFDYLDY